MDDDNWGTHLLAFLLGLAVFGVGLILHTLSDDPHVTANGINEIKRVEIGKGFRLESCDYVLTPSNASVRVEFAKEGK
jgi:hypothetical protein